VDHYSNAHFQRSQLVAGIISVYRHVFGSSDLAAEGEVGSMIYIETKNLFIKKQKKWNSTSFVKVVVCHCTMTPCWEQKKMAPETGNFANIVIRTGHL
jgi:hypothetical protein